jgi:PTH1 family peptidyl-tRNA hydrolase
MRAMQLVLGLGNPGPAYAATRHNVGFRCVEEVARRLGLPFVTPGPEYRLAEGEGPAGPLALLEPLTYMNRSGEALAAWAARTGWRLGATDAAIDAAETAAADADADTDTDADTALSPTPPTLVPIVVCDDIQLPLGSVRIRSAGSDGGQNGLASVLAVVGSRAVPRLRLGVGPRDAALDPAAWADYVLAPFTADEVAVADELVGRGADALLDLLVEGPERAASRHNRRVRLDAPSPSPGVEDDGNLPDGG